MSREVYDIFTGLQGGNSNSKNVFAVAQLPFAANHKIGVSEEGHPIFFVKCSDIQNSTDISLELISVLFNRESHIIEADNLTNDTFTMIVLKSLNIDFHRYFIDVVSILLQQFPDIPTSKSLLIEIEKLVELFQASQHISLSTIRGLWAELFVIERSSNPEYMIAAWHANTVDKFDFNDGKDKVEVKSTSKSERIHTFSLGQLNPNENSKLIIASLFVIQTGIGKSIIDLRDSIISRISDLSLQLKLSEIVIKTIGCDFDKIDSIYFDYQFAIDSIKFYRGEDMPTIKAGDVPPLVTNVHFDSNLADIPEIDDCSAERQLFNAMRDE